MTALREDRAAIDSFASFYSARIGHAANLVSYPEEEEATPPDARIDAIYAVGNAEMHIEHTSIDLVVSGRKRKRDLDPGFTAIEDELKKLSVPPGRGVSVHIPLDVEGPKALKERKSALANRVRDFITQADAKEWSSYRATYHELDCSGVTFRVRAECRGNEIMPGWWGNGHNFLDARGVEERLADLLPSKISKLDVSVRNSSGAAFSVLLVETKDVAAKGFLDWCGEFARVIASQETTLSEVWGLPSGIDPFLIWSDPLDKGRIDSVYHDDPEGRIAMTIIQERLWNWQCSRTEALK